MMADGQSSIECLFGRVAYLPIHEEHLLMYLPTNFSETHRVYTARLSQEVLTQELSETDNTRGEKLEVGILGVMVPLMDGVFIPCATETSALSFCSPRIVHSISRVFLLSGSRRTIKLLLLLTEVKGTGL